ncbi:hypothetical protein [Chromatium okenii]|nr:hypothetical protein [Chromatium okenii]
MSFRLPIEARDRMQRLMSIHNAPSQADVILMALDALESVAPAPAVSAQLDDVVTRIDRMFDDMLARIDTMQQHFAAFEVRLSAIEAGAGESTIVEKAGADSPIGENAGAGKKRARKAAVVDHDAAGATGLVIDSITMVPADLRQRCALFYKETNDWGGVKSMIETELGGTFNRTQVSCLSANIAAWVEKYAKDAEDSLPL